MAKALFRSFTSNKTTDIQIKQDVEYFEIERSKLFKFKREFEKYTHAIQEFDDASHRFFNNLNSLSDSSWSHHSAFAQNCIDIGRIRNEHLRQLHKDINTNIASITNSFDQMQVRIDRQCRVQQDYDKTRRQYQSILKKDEQQHKIDRIKNDLDQLQSALNIFNSQLHEELPAFLTKLKENYIEIIVELFTIHGKYYKTIQKICSRSIKIFRGDRLSESNDFENESNSLAANTSNYKIPCQSIPLPPRQKRYKILYEVRVLHDYRAENDDEIDLNKEEFLTVIGYPNTKKFQHDPGWEYGRKNDGTIGLFPLNFTTRVYENEKNEIRS